MGGILDTWVTIFEADSSSLTQGIDKSKLGADDLITKLKATDDAASKVGGTFKGMIAGAASALAGLLIAKTTITGAFEDAANIQAISATADALGETIGNVDAFGRAATALGGDAQGARDSLTDMAEKMGEAMTDVESGAAKAFTALGIKLKDVNGHAKPAVQGILELAGAVEGLDKAQAVFKIKELGITDNRTVEMVLKGRKELERLIARQKEQGVLTKENAEEARKFTEAWGKLNNAMENIGLGISTALMPAFTKVLDWLGVMAEWLGEHKNLLIGFFGSIAAVVLALYLPAMISAAAATLAATWPILAIVAIVAALAAAFALAYDDIMAFIEGNDSLIGRIFEKYPQVKEIVYGIIEAFKFMGEIVAQVFNSLLTGFKQMLDFVMTGIKQIASGVSTVASFFGIGSDDAPPKNVAVKPSGSGQDPLDVPRVEANDAAQRSGGVPPGQPMASLSTRLGEATSGVAAGNRAIANESVAAGNRFVTAANNTTLNSTTSNAISNSSTRSNETNVQIGEIKVETQATDAAGVAAGVSGELDTQLRQMQSENNTGIAR